MNCQTFRDRWHERADGELSAPDAEALDSHAADCDDCRRYDAQMRAVLAGLDRLRDRPLAATPRSRSSYTFMPFRIAAAVALFVGVTWVLSIALRDRGPAERDIERASTTLDGAADLVTSFTLTGDSSTTYLAMAKPSSEPNVRIYWLYRVSDEPTVSSNSHNNTLN